MGASLSVPGKGGGGGIASFEKIPLEAVPRIARICALGLGLEELLGELCREIQVLSGADWCCVVGCPEEGSSRRDVWSYSPSREWAGLKEIYGPGPHWEALLDRLRADGTLVTQDVPRLPPDHLFRQIYASHPVRSAVIAPLKFGTRIIGILGVHTLGRPGGWGDAVTHVLGDIVAPVVAAALERRGMDETRRASEARYRFLADNAPDFISLHDPSGRYLYASPVSLRMLGYRPEEMMGSPLSGFLPKEDLERVLAEDRRLVTKEVLAHTIQHRLRRKDGSLAEVESVASAVLDDGHDVRHILRVTRDISGRRQAETHLSESQKLETIGMLAGGVAHEFNNLLVGINGAAEMLSLLLSGNVEAEKYLSMIERNGGRAVELTRQLLAYARRGKYQPEIMLFSRPVLEELPILKAALPPGMELRLQLDEDTPPVIADIAQIKQVLMSLCLNAAESMPGGGAITIRTRKEDGPTSGFEDSTKPAGRGFERRLRTGPRIPGPLAVIEVSDTGCGMAEGTLSRIFEPFFSTKFIGRGMGLAAVRGIVDNHDGEIRIVSEPEKGSTFSIYLPGSRGIPSRREGGQLPQAGTGLILVADDEDDVRAMVRAMLESLGYRVLEARNGLEAVEVFRTHRGQIDLVLLDLMMPRMTGEEAFTEIRRISPEARGILASGYDESGRAREIEAKGFLGFLQKPFRRRELGQRVFEALSSRPGEP